MSLFRSYWAKSSLMVSKVTLDADAREAFRRLTPVV